MTRTLSTATATATVVVVTAWEGWDEDVRREEEHLQQHLVRLAKADPPRRHQSRAESPISVPPYMESVGRLWVRRTDDPAETRTRESYLHRQKMRIYSPPSSFCNEEEFDAFISQSWRWILIDADREDQRLWVPVCYISCPVLPSRSPLLDLMNTSSILNIQSVPHYTKLEKCCTQRLGCPSTLAGVSQAITLLKLKKRTGSPENHQENGRFTRLSGLTNALEPSLASKLELVHS